MTPNQKLNNKIKFEFELNLLLFKKTILSRSFEIIVYFPKARFSPIPSYNTSWPNFK
jgi:hypothetical protein